MVNFYFQNYYIMATILEAGSYSRPVVGNPGPDPFFVDQVKVTLSQLDADDADLEVACNERQVDYMYFDQCMTKPARRHVCQVKILISHHGFTV